MEKNGSKNLSCRGLWKRWMLLRAEESFIKDIKIFEEGDPGIFNGLPIWMRKWSKIATELGKTEKTTGMEISSFYFFNLHVLIAHVLL